MSGINGIGKWRIEPDHAEGFGYFIQRTFGDPDFEHALWWSHAYALTKWGALRKLRRLAHADGEGSGTSTRSANSGIA